MFDSVKEIVDTANKTGKAISELIIEDEIKTSGLSRAEIWKKMQFNLQTMQKAVKRGESGKGVISSTGLTGGEAVKVAKYRQTHKTLSGDTMMGAVQAAMATNEVNAALGIICATPTAGSSGTLPGVIASLEKRLNLDEDALVRFLFTAGGFGLVIANHAGIAGATGGCQAEVVVLQRWGQRRQLKQLEEHRSNAPKRYRLQLVICWAWFVIRLLVWLKFHVLNVTLLEQLMLWFRLT